MRVIPVLDLAHGVAVHARGGRREEYAPARSVLTPEGAADGDPLALALGYRERLGVAELYVADLDAIGGASRQEASLRELCSGAHAWVDAGVATAEHAAAVEALGAARVIVALETLPSLEALREIVAAAGEERVALSIDLRGGVPVTRAPELARLAPAAIAELGAAAGARSVVMIDLARVGAGAGVDLELVRALRRALPEVELVAGGGVRGPADLERLAEGGADAALVGSALHDGRIGADTIAALTRAR
ncbi:MAG TPA: HisA/HisF-related TIM barrel protein [Gemmatimonadaceae bacterium]|nr:HisA/HisF-related TIM barrel protein [Gemmatimonadaceae bacterium]